MFTYRLFAHLHFGAAGGLRFSADRLADRLLLARAHHAHALSAGLCHDDDQVLHPERRARYL